RLEVERVAEDPHHLVEPYLRVRPKEFDYVLNGAAGAQPAGGPVRTDSALETMSSGDVGVGRPGGRRVIADDDVHHHGPLDVLESPPFFLAARAEVFGCFGNPLRTAVAIPHVGVAGGLAERLPGPRPADEDR